MPIGTKQTQGETLSKTHRARQEALFKGKTFRVISEVHRAPGETMFKTPLGNRGRHGFILEEVDSAPPYRFVIGKAVLDWAEKEYGPFQRGDAQALVEGTASTIPKTPENGMGQSLPEQTT